MQGLTFQVNPRIVGTNPADPDGLRRSQRAALQAVMFGSERVAFHGPTGAGKSHLLRAIVAVNSKSKKPRKLIFTFPIHALVNQQAAEVDASYLDPEESFDRLQQLAKMNPDGPEAKAFKVFLSTYHLPTSFRNGTLFSELLQAPIQKPMAVTPDSLVLAIKGVLAGESKTVDTARIKQIVQMALKSYVPRAIVETASAEIEKTVSPHRFGRHTPEKLRAIIRVCIHPQHIPMRALNSAVSAIVETTQPEDMTPGPKYTYDPIHAVRLKQILANSLVVFDEYHLLAQYQAFKRLLDRLKRLGARVLLMSGTPRRDFLQVMGGFQEVDFDKTEDEALLTPGEPTAIFNQPMEVTVRAENFHSQGFNPVTGVKAAIRDWDAQAPGPCVVIFESVRRCLRTYEALQKDPSTQGRLLLWTGPEKDSNLNLILRNVRRLPKNAIVLGTSAVELGVDLPLRNAYMEVIYHDAALQRIGRIGRMGSDHQGSIHHVILLVRGSTLDAAALPGGHIERKDLDRTLSRLTHLPAARPDQRYEGLWLRGNREFQFLALVRDNGKWKSVRGSQALLGIYPPAPIEGLENWAFLAPSSKREVLRGLDLPEEFANRVLFGEHFNTATAAYLSHGSDPKLGAIQSRDSIGPSKKKVRRTWFIGRKVLLTACVPAPSKKPSHLVTMAVSEKSV